MEGKVGDIMSPGGGHGPRIAGFELVRSFTRLGSKELVELN